MEQDQAIKVFESLASGVRLDVYRLLMRQGPDGLVAGEIASTLGVAPPNLSFHLKALTQAGLLSVAPRRPLPALPRQPAADAGADRLPDRRVLRRSSRAVRRAARHRIACRHQSQIAAGRKQLDAWADAAPPTPFFP